MAPQMLHIAKAAKEQVLVSLRDSHRLQEGDLVTSAFWYRIKDKRCYPIYCVYFSITSLITPTIYMEISYLYNRINSSDIFCGLQASVNEKMVDTVGMVYMTL